MKTMNFALAAAVAASLPAMAAADQWRVTGVAPNDMLNVRSGPSTSFSVLERLAPDEGGLEKEVCVYLKPTPGAQPSANMAEWCAISDGSGQMIGWVNARHLTQGRHARPNGSQAAFPLLEAYPGYEGCYLVGESEITVTYMDDSADLVACKDPSRGQVELALMLDKEDDIEGYDLFLVPIR